MNYGHENQEYQRLIVEYILTYTEDRFVLAYKDYTFIAEWIRMCPDFRQLLGLLSDILPFFFSRQEHKVCSLKKVDRILRRRLRFHL